jgi:2-polyprenyl-3-methyl-5-hydroxy-6-metoxy-1,4-benzoquinol methylase
MTTTRACWCGNADLLPFNEDYARCPACETLVLRLRQDRRLDRVENDDEDFYGRNYWFGHQEAHLGHANLFVRARQDLTERCVYWLRTLLKYAPPAGPSLEIGCAHGAFVALLQWAGFDAAGLELSPWIAEFARQAFGVSVYSGPVEEQDIAPASLRVVVAMDVLEHLEDPVGTVGHCVTRLAADGVGLFQTPCYPEGATYEALIEQKSPFLEMLQPQEHIYLFSRSAAQELMRRSGAAHIVFEPAIFAHYDMCFLTSRQPLQVREPADVDRVLMAASPGRLVRAMLDLDDRRLTLTRELAERDAHVSWLKGMIHDLEADRAARLAVIERQGLDLGRIPALEADVAYLKGQIEAAEVDRAARLAVIERQGSELGRIPGLEADVAYLKAQVQHLDNQVQKLDKKADKKPDA